MEGGPLCPKRRIEMVGVEEVDTARTCSPGRRVRWPCRRLDGDDLSCSTVEVPRLTLRRVLPLDEQDEMSSQSCQH